MTQNNKDGTPELHASDINSSSSSIDAVAENFTNMAVLDDNSTATLSICANCGKEEDGDNNSLKFCGACKLVKYCSAACQKAHRPMHKKECNQRAAEIYDEKLFQDHPPREDCPICMLPLPLNDMKSVFKLCCGKLICKGCIHEMKKGGKEICAFCRSPSPTSDEDRVKRVTKLIGNGNAKAFNTLAGYYAHGREGLSQNWAKAIELWLRAGELGCASSYHNLGLVYYNGEGDVEVDKKKAKHYYELAAMKGCVSARYGAGVIEGQAGYILRAKKHFIIAAKAGHEGSLDMVKKGFMNGPGLLITKDEYANTLRSYQKSINEMKSDMRDQAAKTN